MRNLRKRVLSFFILIFAIFSILFVMFFHSVVSRHTLDQLESETEAQTLMLASQISNEDLETMNLQEIESQLDQTSNFIDQEIILMDDENNILYNSLNKTSITPIVNEISEINWRDSRETVSSWQSRHEGNRTLFTVIPLYDSSREARAVLSLLGNLDAVEAQSNEILLFALIFSLISIALIFFFTYYWTGKISKPIQEIKTVTDQLSQMNYQVRYQGSSYDEIDELGYAINDLATNLDQQMKEIQKNDRRLMELINHLVIGVILIDENRKLQIINPVVNEIFDMNLYANVGKDYSELIKSAEIVELIEKTMRKQKPQNKEITLYLQNERIVDVNVVPAPGRTSNHSNYIVLLYDITEIRRLEKVRTDFVANASHELRTPITALKGFSETLLDGAMHDKEVLTEFLEIMLKESTRLDTMVQDILQISRLEQRPGLGSEERVNLNEITEEVLQVLQQKAEVKKITCRIKSEDTVKLNGNRDELKQILMNLVGNAIAYTQSGGLVEISLKEEDQQATINVIDNGIGIPKDQQTRIFERFYRVDKARSRNAGGTGLGLSIVKWLVENMDGSISLESQKGEGSSFTVNIPLNTME